MKSIIRRTRGRAKAEIVVYDDHSASFHLYDPARGLSFTQQCTQDEAIHAINRFIGGHDITPQEVKT